MHQEHGTHTGIKAVYFPATYGQQAATGIFAERYNGAGLDSRGLFAKQKLGLGLLETAALGFVFRQRRRQQFSQVVIDDKWLRTGFPLSGFIQLIWATSSENMARIVVSAMANPVLSANINPARSVIQETKIMDSYPLLKGAWPPIYQRNPRKTV